MDSLAPSLRNPNTLGRSEVRYTGGTAMTPIVGLSLELLPNVRPLSVSRQRCLRSAVPLGAFDRERLDALVRYFNTLMETHGANEAPIYPGIAIIPLAVYRPIVGSY